MKKFEIIKDTKLMLIRDIRLLTYIAYINVFTREAWINLIPSRLRDGLLRITVKHLADL